MGNPAIQNRWQGQTYTISTDEPLESEWYQLRDDAIKDAKRRLEFEFKRFGVTDMCVKIHNNMNWKQPPIIVTRHSDEIHGTSYKVEQKESR